MSNVSTAMIEQRWQQRSAERKQKAIVPGGATLIDPGDHCLVICKAERVDEVREAFAL